VFSSPTIEQAEQPGATAALVDEDEALSSPALVTEVANSIVTLGDRCGVEEVPGARLEQDEDHNSVESSEIEDEGDNTRDGEREVAETEPGDSLPASGAPS
jgi:hypothetical protein